MGDTAGTGDAGSGVAAGSAVALVVAAPLLLLLLLLLLLVVAAAAATAAAAPVAGNEPTKGGRVIDVGAGGGAADTAEAMGDGSKRKGGDCDRSMLLSAAEEASCRAAGDNRVLLCSSDAPSEEEAPVEATLPANVVVARRSSWVCSVFMAAASRSRWPMYQSCSLLCS